jgi:hypothetical protein
VDAFGLSEVVIYREILLIPTFRRCDDTSAKASEMKEASNNYLTIRTNDGIVNSINPVNPDSKLQVKADEIYIETCLEKRENDAFFGQLSY